MEGLGIRAQDSEDGRALRDLQSPNPKPSARKCLDDWSLLLQTCWSSLHTPNLPKTAHYSKKVSGA